MSLGFLRSVLPLTARRRIKLALRVLANGPTSSPLQASPEEDSRADGTPPTAEILIAGSCPVCGDGGRTLVCEWNKFLLFDRPPDKEAARYDYSLCHACGVVYAVRRPAGARYRWLFEHFEATIGRTTSRQRSVRQLSVSSVALTDAERAELRTAAARGVFVSQHVPISRREYIPGLLSDRLSGAQHVELLGSLLDLRSQRVLEIRTRSAAISATLARLYGTRAHVMALFENQRFVIEETYHFPTSPLNYDDFQIPDSGPFDLIIANHVLTHAVHPAAFLAAARRALSPGGRLYLYNEPDDAEYLANEKSMINTLNAFHLQAFDGPSLTRALAANGLETVFLTEHEGGFLSLSQVAPDQRSSARMDAAERDRRLRVYLKARDSAILMAPPSVRRHFASEWEAVVERALENGSARMDGDGRVHFKRAVNPGLSSLRVR